MTCIDVVPGKDLVQECYKYITSTAEHQGAFEDSSSEDPAVQKPSYL